MRIVMTGATAGFGLFAATRLADAGHSLTIGARALERDPQRENRARQAGLRAYSSSKLCNIMTARESAKRYPALTVMSFDPGYVPHTSLGRDNPQWVATLVSYIVPLLMRRDRSSTIPRSGQFLADLAVSDRYANSRGSYWAVRGKQLLQISPSILARDDAACTALWEDSARLVGLPCA